MGGLEFEARYYRDRLQIVNSAGDVGIVTLWSPVTAAKRRLAEMDSSALDPVRSRIAVISNLYGDGLYLMFCNLLYNPQLRHIVAIGESLGLPTCDEITSFLARGFENAVVFGRDLKRIPGHPRLFPSIAEFDESRLRETLTFRYLGRLSGSGLELKLPKYLRSLGEAPAYRLSDRLRVELPEVSSRTYSQLPSQIAAHDVVRRRPLDCWEELVVRCMRFGRHVIRADEQRRELLNTKAVISDPAPENEVTLASMGFSLRQLRYYQTAIMSPAVPDGVQYTYGNRLRGYFPQRDSNHDTLDTVIRMLKDDPETRRGYISLWDSANDLANSDDGLHDPQPCLASLFFRCIDGRLTLTGTFRSQDLLDAWLANVYGLIAVQQYVARETGLAAGPLTVVSHSLSIDLSSSRHDLARAIADSWRRDDDRDRTTGRRLLREDPNGYFVVGIDETDSSIFAERWFNGLLIKRYRSRRAAVIEREIVGDMAVSLVSHALWLGRELAAKEQQLKERRSLNER